MLGKFVLELKQQDSMTRIFVGGPIDEDASFTGVDLGAGCKELVINFAKVTLLNSCGIRAWIKWIQTVPPSVKIAFEECPKIVVDQINIVDGFLPKGAEVRSFDIPYFCEACEGSTIKSCKKGESYSETVPCSKCGKEAEIDVIESKYFSFLKS